MDTSGFLSVSNCWGGSWGQSDRWLVASPGLSRWEGYSWRCGAMRDFHSLSRSAVTSYRRSNPETIASKSRPRLVGFTHCARLYDNVRDSTLAGKVGSRGRQIRRSLNGGEGSFGSARPQRRWLSALTGVVTLGAYRRVSHFRSLVDPLVRTAGNPRTRIRGQRPPARFERGLPGGHKLHNESATQFSPSSTCPCTLL